MPAFILCSRPGLCSPSAAAAPSARAEPGVSPERLWGLWVTSQAAALPRVAAACGTGQGAEGGFL